MEQTVNELKQIMSANNDLKSRLNEEKWSIRYDRKSDMLLMGNDFPEATFYFPVDNTGILLRIDKENKIHGFSIENTKLFIKEHPDMKASLSYFVYPIRSRIFNITKDKFEDVKSILTVSRYVAGEVVFAN